MTSPDRTAPDAVPADEDAPTNGDPGGPGVGASALPDDDTAVVTGPAGAPAAVTGEVVPAGSQARPDTARCR